MPPSVVEPVVVASPVASAVLASLDARPPVVPLESEDPLLVVAASEEPEESEPGFDALDAEVEGSRRSVVLDASDVVSENVSLARPSEPQPSPAAQPHRSKTIDSAEA